MRDWPLQQLPRTTCPEALMSSCWLAYRDGYGGRVAGQVEQPLVQKEC